MLKYWCVLDGDTVIFYSLSRVDAYEKLEELKQAELNNG